MFPLLVSHGNMIPASQPQIPYCRISCMCVSFARTSKEDTIMLKSVTSNQLGM